MCRGSSPPTCRTRWPSWPLTPPSTSPASRCPSTPATSSRRGSEGRPRCGRGIVITGASQGQGAVEARPLQAEGAPVVAVDVKDPVEPIDGVTYRRLDVSKPEEWAALAADL